MVDIEIGYKILFEISHLILYTRFAFAEVVKWQTR